MHRRSYGNFTGGKVRATSFRDKKPIEGVCTTVNVVIIGACVMSLDFVIGDLCLFVLNFLTSSLLGHDPPKVVRADTRILNTQISIAERKKT